MLKYKGYHGRKEEGKSLNEYITEKLDESS